MGLASRIQWDADVPHEPGQSFRFRQLNGAQLEEAREVRQRKVMRQYGDMVELVQQLQTADMVAVRAAQADLLNTYDVDTLLRYGIVSWTYDEPLTLENVADLDAATREWAARQVIAPLVTTEAETKNS